MRPRVFASIGLAAGLVACGPSSPDEAQARAWAAERSELQAALERDVRAALDDIEHFGVPADDLPCSPPTAPDNPVGAGLGGLRAQTHCTSERIALLQTRSDRINRFAEETTPVLRRQHGLLQLDISYQMPGEQNWSALGRDGRLSSVDENQVLAWRGPALGDGQIGYGLYRDPAQQGILPTSRPGIEVMFYTQYRAARVRIVWSVHTD